MLVIGGLVTTAMPAVTRMTNSAKRIRVKSEIKVLAAAVCTLASDLSARGIPVEPGSRERLVLLVGAGNTPLVAEGAGLDWGREVGDPAVGLMDAYMLGNTMGFTEARKGSLTVGWNGPYLMTPAPTDPWGNRYSVNAALFGTCSGRCAVVVSAGPDSTISVPFDYDPARMSGKHGDDIYQIMSGE